MPARGVPVQYLQDHIKKMQENNLFVRDYNVSTVYYNHAGPRRTRTVSTGPYQENAGEQPLFRDYNVSTLFCCYAMEFNEQ